MYATYNQSFLMRICKVFIMDFGEHDFQFPIILSSSVFQQMASK